MKPTVDDDEILTGEGAIERMTSTWQDLGMGKVGLEVVRPYLVVWRHGGEYTTFIPIAGGTAVTITAGGDATTRHVPDDLKPEEGPSEEQYDALTKALVSDGTGSYPLPEEGVFAIGYRDGEEHKQVEVGLTDDHFAVTDQTP
jgi:hypothetical protein